MAVFADPAITYRFWLSSAQIAILPFAVRMVAAVLAFTSAVVSFLMTIVETAPFTAPVGVAPTAAPALTTTTT